VPPSFFTIQIDWALNNAIAPLLLFEILYFFLGLLLIPRYFADYIYHICWGFALSNFISSILISASRLKLLFRHIHSRSIEHYTRYEGITFDILRFRLLTYALLISLYYDSSAWFQISFGLKHSLSPPTSASRNQGWASLLSQGLSKCLYRRIFRHTIHHAQVTYRDIQITISREMKFPFSLSCRLLRQALWYISW
jgi:hypothetical protein